MKKIKSNWIYGISTHKSSVRNINEDNAYLNTRKDKIGNELLVTVIADGMGGYKAGEVASQFIVMEIDKWFRTRASVILDLPYPLIKISSEMKVLLREVNKTLIKHGREMGTTASVLFLYKDKFLTVHVGDSRIYHITENHYHEWDINQVTEDHSWVMDQVRKGLLTIEEAEKHPRRNVIMQCIGVNGNISPYIKKGSFSKRDKFLLCSDGFYTIYPEKMLLESIQSFEVSEQSYQPLTDHLVKDANSKGATDNITVSIITSG